MSTPETSSSKPKTVVVAVGRGDDMTTFEHAAKITTPADRLLFVSAVKENGSRDQFQRATSRVFEQYAARCSEINRQCEFRQLFFNEPGASSTRTRRWEIADALCIAAQVNRADTLVLGFRSLGRIDRSLRGSVSDHCSRDCPVSVAIVKLKDGYSDQ